MTTATTVREPSAAGSSRPDLTLTTSHVADISSARRRVAETLESRGCTECLVETAVLLVTELLGNALKHAEAGSEPLGARLDVHWNGHHLTVSVTDPDPRLPVTRSADVDAEDGRGLALLEVLATCWGALPLAAGKTVWCLIC